MDKKICPLMSVAACSAGHTPLCKCEGEACAWWVRTTRVPTSPAQGYCAVMALGSLPELMQAVRGL